MIHKNQFLKKKLNKIKKLKLDFELENTYFSLFFYIKNKIYQF